MKFLFLSIFLLQATFHLSSQNYFPPDSARQIILTAKIPEEKFYGYWSLDRYYYRSGLYDSSAIAEKEMYAIAKSLNRDSLLGDANLAIGNKFMLKADYNFGLLYYLKGLEFAKDDYRKARYAVYIAGIYALSGNNRLALDYLRKSDSYPGNPNFMLFRNTFYGHAFNGIQKPDSALYYLQKTEEAYKTNPDVLPYAGALGQYGKAYELKGDTDLAAVYYKKSLAFCKKVRLLPSYIIICNRYCNYLITLGHYTDARSLTLENLLLAKQTGNNDGIARAAETLQKVYNHFSNMDSAYYYAIMQIAYKDSVSNQKRIAEFQNLIFAQQLKEIDEQVKLTEAANQRKQNLQYVLISLGIVTFIIFFLLLSRSVITNTKVIEFLGVIALLIVFEFLNLLLHPFLEKLTHDSPLLMLLALVCIAALLVPLHHRLQKWATHKLVEKNKKIRLAAAKKTIERLEGEKLI